jgi:signal transduction histidine kinase
MSAQASIAPTQYLPPKYVIILGVLFVFICIGISTQLAINTQWLGIQVAPHEKGLIVTDVHKDGPAHTNLKSGDIITGIKSSIHQPLAVKGLDIMEDPYDLKLYSEFDNFFARQTAIYDRLKNSPIFMIANNKHEVTITPKASRPLETLPFSFWYQLVCGSLGLLIGVSVFAFRQNEIATRCFALSGIGLMIIITAAAMYSSRELAIDGDLFYQLTLANQYGTVLFIAFGSAVIFYSPRRLSTLPVATILFCLYCLFALLHTLGVWQTLNAGIRFPIFFYIILITLSAIFSWRYTRGRPTSRAILKWMLFSWFVGIALFQGLRLIPVALGIGSIIPQAAAWTALLFIYMGVAFGLIRYRLFNLDRWVLKAWFWIFSGLAVYGLDLLLVSQLDLSTSLSITISLAVIGWIYFPIRQLLWGRFSLGLKRIDYEGLVPEIIKMVLTPDPHVDLDKNWQSLLQKIFKPLEIREHKGQQKDSRITRNGFGLYLPALPGGNSLELTGANRADRLFNPNDVRFASAAWEVFNRAFEYRQAFEQGAEMERQRIARDLHDDVAARLLTLVHRADDSGYEKLARHALRALRDTIYSLSPNKSLPLDALLADLRYEIRQRLDAIEIKLTWNMSGDLADIALKPRQHINLHRIMQELISNIINHTNSDEVDILIVVKNAVLHIAVCDDGIGGNIDQWTLGKGINNIKNRVQELRGDVNWGDRTDNHKGCCVKLQIPF